MDLEVSKSILKIVREKLMSKNSIPQIRFQGFDSWWETIKLTDLGISVGGTAIESEFDPDGKYKVISIGSYSEESKYKDQGIRAIHSKKTERRILEKDDLTMILNDKTGTGKIIGRVLLIDEDNSYVYNQRTQRICLDKNKYVPDFIFQLLNADINRNKIVRSAQGNTQIYVNWSDISNLDYLIPDSFDEQSAIGFLFRTLDDLLASYKDNLANYQSLKTTMLSKMFPKAGQRVPEIRLNGFEGEWEIRKLNEVSEVYDGTHQTPNYTESGVKFLSVENISTLESEKYISEEDFEKDFKVFPEFGDVLMTRIGSIGIPNIVKTNEKIAFYVSLALLKPKKRTNSLFLKSSIESNPFQEELWKKTLHIAFPKKINKNDISQSIIKWPSYEEQQAIGAYFSNLDNLINSHQEKISQLETLKKKLLQDIFI